MKEVHTWLEEMSKKIYQILWEEKVSVVGLRGIPRGGTVIAALLRYHDPEKRFVSDIAKDMSFQILIDDIYDTGGTYRRVRHMSEYQDRWFMTMLYRCTKHSNTWHDRPIHRFHTAACWTTDEYLVFPWEHDDAHLRQHNSEEPKERA